MDNGNGITKADLKAALTELKSEIRADFAGVTSDSCGNITAALQRFEANMIAAKNPPSER